MSKNSGSSAPAGPEANTAKGWMRSPHLGFAERGSQNQWLTQVNWLVDAVVFDFLHGLLIEKVKSQRILAIFYFAEQEVSEQNPLLQAHVTFGDGCLHAA